MFPLKGRFNAVFVTSSPRRANHVLFVAIFTAIACCHFWHAAAQNAPESLEIGEGIETCGLSGAEIDAGWIALVDGKTTFGWRSQSDANWAIDQGILSVSTGTSGLLRTTSQFDDFELCLDFKIGPDSNSGVFVRTSPNPNDPAKDCFEINLAAPHVSPFSTGALVARQKAADISKGDASWYDAWHACRIVALGPSIKVWIDDQQTMDYSDPLGDRCLGKGFIGLQKNEGPVAFRRLKLRPLGMPAIFNGTDLTGWSTDQKLESKFKVTPTGELQILSGRGQIETQSRFGNFIFSMQCRTNADQLNSGVFFRCIPGEIMNGYESQIQNGFQDDDRTQPADQGTGAIFRRTVARRVNANDQAWFAKTIIADGAHVAVWVNGLQVTDWSDQRKKDKNPRRGQRLEAGSIIFQGHDPTTDVLFRNIQAREIHARR